MGRCATRGAFYSDKGRKKYDATKNASFTTYVCKSSENNLKLIIRKEKAQKRTSKDGKATLSLSEDNFGNPVELYETINRIEAKEDLIYTEELLKNIVEIGEEIYTEDEKNHARYADNYFLH